MRSCGRNWRPQAGQKGYLALHEELQALDPAAAEKIDPRNLRRTIRALEVIRLTGKKFSEQGGKTESPYRLLTIGLTRPRPELYARVDARIEAMFAAGLLDEVQRLLDSGCSPDLPTMSAIGYRECIQVLARFHDRGAGQGRDAPADAHLRAPAGQLVQTGGPFHPLVRGGQGQRWKRLSKPSENF